MSKLLCISQSFTPSTTPTAIRAGKLVEQLAARHEVLVLTESTGTRPQGRAQVQEVRSRRPARLLALLRSAGRWSMLDVFVLALVIFAVKAQPLAEVETASALLPFTLAILLTAFAAHRIQRAG